jgi:hypothetical protein
MFHPKAGLPSHPLMQSQFHRSGRWIVSLALIFTIGCIGSNSTDLISGLADAIGLDTAILAESINQETLSDLSQAFATEAQTTEQIDISDFINSASADRVAAPMSTESAFAVADTVQLADANMPPLAGGALEGRFFPHRGHLDPNRIDPNLIDPNLPAHPPRGGEFHGRWYYESSETPGSFHGRYRNLPPEVLPEGLVAGGVFRGVYLGSNGHLRGFLNGRFGENEAGEGHFVGRWVDGHSHTIGGLHGRWQDDPNAAGGVIVGDWVQFDLCAEVDSLPAFNFDPNDLGGLDSSDVMLPMDPYSREASDDAAAEELPAEICGRTPDALFGGFYQHHGRDPNDPNADPLPGERLRARWHTPDGQHLALFGHYRPLRPMDPNDPNANPIDPNDPNNSLAPPRPMLLGVYYGILVDHLGETAGFIRGAYGLSAHHVGVMRGEWLDADGVQIGVLRGHWLPTPRHRGGPFRGAAFLNEDSEAELSEAGLDSAIVINLSDTDLALP